MPITRSFSAFDETFTEPDVRLRRWLSSRAVAPVAQLDEVVWECGVGGVEHQANQFLLRTLSLYEPQSLSQTLHRPIGTRPRTPAIGRGPYEGLGILSTASSQSMQALRNSKVSAMKAVHS